jgi:hypothetical protein
VSSHPDFFQKEALRHECRRAFLFEYLSDESCAVEVAVQTDDFENLPPAVVIGAESINSGHFESGARG